jgi:serine/threonine-protein kinase
MSDLLEQISTALADRYRIERQLGAGGMAMVYLAEDLKHARRVAVKVLRPEVAVVVGAERFLREIRVTANLQHPHILPLHDSGEAGGFVFYVMPFVRGESLRDSLNRERQLPVEDALRITGAVAHALDYAHRQDVIHRDIKPENILLHDGQPVVADFGIALAVSALGGTRLTETGLAVGTPQYMSPEQATGERTIDGRSDVYSLGCVLYEMLAGEPPFTGPTAQGILAKAVTERPRAITEVRDSVPPNVAAAVTKALERLPADRFQTGEALAHALTDASARQGPDRAAVAGIPWLRDRRSQAAVFAAVTIAAVSIWSLASRDDPAAQPVAFRVEAPPSYDFSASSGQTVAVSSDGHHVAYIAGPTDSGRRVFLRSLEQPNAVAVPGIGDANGVFFSPDGSWLGVFDRGSLVKVPLTGGSAGTRIDGVTTFSIAGAWTRDGRILYLRTDRVWVGSADGSSGRALSPTTLDGEAYTVTAIVLLPAERTALVGVIQSPRPAGIATLNLESGEITPLLEEARVVGFVDGHLLHARPDGVLVATPFDEERLEFTGAPVALPVNVGTEGWMRWGATEKLFAFLEGGASKGQLMLADRNGSVEALGGAPLKAWIFMRFSPDGRKVAAEIHEAGGHIWVYDIETLTLTRLTSEGHNSRPAWSPDGSLVAYIRYGSPHNQIIVRPADASEPETIVRGSADAQSFDWYPSGERLAVSGRGDIWSMRLRGDTVASPLIATPAGEGAAVISPDGAWLAYVSEESGTPEVYLRAADGTGPRMVVSVGGGEGPSWAPGGQELFYSSPSGFVSARLAFEPRFQVERQVLFDIPGIGPGGGDPRHAIHPDGERILFARQASASEVRLQVIVNFREQLRRWIAAATP